jgi:3'-phosphoadenosine 5'-phosphosulfate sulfotransferase (PAPS reductase)/FAD synthetase
MKKIKECFESRTITFFETIYDFYTRRKELKAMEILMGLNNRKAVVAFSGKDSLVAMHIALRVMHRPVVVNRYVGTRQLPSEVVQELVQVAINVGAEVIVTDYRWNRHSSLFVLIARNFDADVITGLREQEDGDDGFLPKFPINNGMHYVVSPVYNWRHSDIWAYISRYDLPVPEMYCNNDWRQSLQSLIFQ